MSTATSDSDGLTLEVQVQPRAAKTAIRGWRDGRLVIALNAPPVDGAANKALLAFLSKRFRVAKSRVILLQGIKSRQKRLRIEGADPQIWQAILSQWPDGSPAIK